MNDEPVAIAQVAVEEIRGRIGVIDDDALDLLFREARSHNGWQDRPVPDELRELVDHFEATGEVLGLERFPLLAEAAK